MLRDETTRHPHSGLARLNRVRQPHHTPAARASSGRAAPARPAVVGHQDHVAPPRPQPVEHQDRLAVGLARRPSSCTTSSRSPWNVGCLTVAVTVPITRPSCITKSSLFHVSNKRSGRSQDGITQTASPRRSPSAAGGRRSGGWSRPRRSGRRSRTTARPRRPGRAPAGLGPLTTKTVQSISLPIFDITEVSREWRIAVWP